MSKDLQPIIYVDERVSSVSDARQYAEKANENLSKLKGGLLSLVMATPRDITAEGEDPISNVNERFEEIWNSLWDAFVDSYKYTVIADDAEFYEGSLVRKVFEEEAEELKKFQEEQIIKKEFFQLNKGVLNEYNIDDYHIFNEYLKGNIPNKKITKEERDRIIGEIKERECKILNDALKNIIEDGE